MATVGSPASPGATSWFAALARRMTAGASIVQLLTVLTLIPAVSLPVFGWFFVQDRLRVSSDAGLVEDALADVAGLDRLREALRLETQGQLLQSAVQYFHLTPAERTDSRFGVLPRPLRDQRAQTDAALAQVRGAPLIAFPDGAAAIEAISRRVTSTRSAAETLGTARAATVRAVLLPVMNAYTDIGSTVGGLERAAFREISSGQLGASSVRLLRATGQIQAVGDLILQATQQQTQYAGMVLTGITPARLAALTASTGSVDTLSAQVGPSLSGGSVVLWKNLLSDPRLSGYLDDVRALIAAGYRGQVLPVISLGTLAAHGDASLAVSAQLSQLMAVSIAGAVAVAHHDQAAAARRARVALISTLLTLLATFLVLVGIGGKIRRGLGELADAAERLSGGRLELMTVRGPREMAFVSRGLNDAVRSLRDISRKADLISRGDIRSPLLEQPSPGPLGAAMEASFRQVVTTMRERELLQDALAHQATHDPLTGLVNRAEAERLLMQAVSERRHGVGRIGLLFVDLDHFKQCNDTYGHPAGDHVLRVCSQRLKNELRADDVACRLGGDEFVVIVKNVTQVEAVGTGERIVAAIREPITYLDHELRISASVGITVWPAEDDSWPQVPDHTEAEVAALAQQILAEADRALYRAKAAGRDVAFF